MFGRYGRKVVAICREEKRMKKITGMIDGEKLAKIRLRIGIHRCENDSKIKEDGCREESSN